MPDPHNPTSRTGGGLPMIATNPITVNVSPGLATSLIYTDAQGLATQLDFPPNATTQTTTIALTPELLTSARPDFISTGHALELVAFQNGDLNKGFVFNAPVTITINYSDNDVQRIPSEDRLTLYWWSGFEWRDAIKTCQPAASYLREPTYNRVSLSICYPGCFGLFSTFQMYLPVIFQTQLAFPLR